jgi:hypothetical protein
MSEKTITCSSGHQFKITGENKIGEIIGVEAIPKEGYIFKSWEDGNIENPRSFDIRECGKHYIAIFEEIDIPTPDPEPEPIPECDYETIYISLCEILGIEPGEYNSDLETLTCEEISEELNKIIG